MVHIYNPGSAQLRQSGSIQNIEYASVDGLSLRLDAFLPESPTRTPAVIIVHGGGWVRGDRRVDVKPLFAPLSQAGIAWFSIDYRLAQDITQFGVAIDDVQSAIRFVKSHADEYNIDTSRLSVIGESAGGQLAAMAILKGGEALRVSSFIGIYTPTDLVALIKESNYIPPQLRDSIRGTPWENLILAGLAQLSPIQNITAGMPPFLLIHGTADTLVPFSQSQRMCQQIIKAGGTCELYAVPGAGHGIRWWDGSAIDSGYKDKLVSWLRRH